MQQDYWCEKLNSGVGIGGVDERSGNLNRPLLSTEVNPCKDLIAHWQYILGIFCTAASLWPRRTQIHNLALTLAGIQFLINQAPRGKRWDGLKTRGQLILSFLVSWWITNFWFSKERKEFQLTWRNIREFHYPPYDFDFTRILLLLPAELVSVPLPFAIWVCIRSHVRPFVFESGT